MIVCHVHASAWGGLKRVSDSLEMDLLLVVSTMWVLGTSFRCLKRYQMLLSTEPSSQPVPGFGALSQGLMYPQAGLEGTDIDKDDLGNRILLPLPPS